MALNEVSLLVPFLIIATIAFIVVIMCMALLIDLKLRSIIKRFDRVIEYVESKSGNAKEES